MAKYHINPKTGNPNICRAATACPFGGEDVHYPTKDTALAAYEDSQKGSFQQKEVKPGEELPQDYRLESGQDYANARLGTVVQFANGLRFVKNGFDTWETSQDGGLILDNDELAAYPIENKIERFSKVQSEFGAKPASGLATVKASLLQHSSYEEGLQSRKYFLLLNHKNTEQLKAANGKVKDQELVDDVTAFNKAEKERDVLAAAVAKASNNVFASKTEAQKAGYEKILADKRAKLSDAQIKLDSADAKIGKHMQKYAKQLVIHRRSLDSLERLAESGVRSQPPGIGARIAKLEKLSKETKSISPIRAKLNSGLPADTLAAAKEFGNPIYIENAEELVASKSDYAAVHNEIQNLNRAKNSVSSAEVQASIAKELSGLEAKRDSAFARWGEAQTKLKLFTEDVRDRADQERDVARELKALKIIAS